MRKPDLIANSAFLAAFKIRQLLINYGGGNNSFLNKSHAIPMSINCAGLSGQNGTASVEPGLSGGVRVTEFTHIPSLITHLGWSSVLNKL